MTTTGSAMWHLDVHPQAHMSACIVCEMFLPVEACFFFMSCCLPLFLQFRLLDFLMLHLLYGVPIQVMK